MAELGNASVRFALFLAVAAFAAAIHAGRTQRGDEGTKTKPIASAPSRTASSASRPRVIPQIFTQHMRPPRGSGEALTDPPTG